MEEYLHSIYLPNTVWLLDGIEYQTDTYGFRNKEDYENVDIVTLGCSDTFGIGNNDELIWPSLIRKQSSKKVINLGVPGGSIDTCYRVLKGFLSKYKTKEVYLLIPGISRNEFYVNSKYGEPQCIQIGPNFHKVIQDEDISKLAEKIFDHITACSINAKLNQTGYIDAINWICKKNNIKLVKIGNPIHEPDWDDSYKLKDFTLAADKLHLGHDYQKLIFDRFINKLEY